MDYLLKASAVITIFYLCYKLFLQRETFFETNRWFLLIGLFVAVSIPFVVIPIYIEYTPTPHEVFALSIETANEAIIETPFDFMQLLPWAYSIGIIFFLGKLCIEFLSLLLLFKSHKTYKNDSYSFVETNTDVAPFSFFKWIVYNPHQFQDNELGHILAHEKVHAKQQHSIDVIIAQLSCVIFWFNPFIWLYKKDLQQNLEFIADKKAQDISNCEKSYQLVLLKSSVANHQLVVTNNFYNSLIKKRIVMLHKSKSNKLNAWKYALILPVLALFLMSANTKEIFIEKKTPTNDTQSAHNASVTNDFNPFYDNLEEMEQQQNTNQNTSTSTPITAVATTNQNVRSSQIIHNKEMVLITKDNTDAELDKLKKKLKKEGITVKFKGVKRNNNGEITAIKIDARSKESNASFNISSNDAINPIKISFDRNGNNIAISNTNNIHFGKGYSFVTKEGNHKLHSSEDDHNLYVYRNSTHHGEDDDVHFKYEIIEDGDKIVIKNGATTHDIKKKHFNKGVYVISGNANKVVEIRENIRIKTDNDGNIIKEFKSKDGNVEIIVNDHDDNSYEITTTSDKKNNTYFFTSTDGKTPLFLLDGKEISEDEIQDLAPDTIKHIEVLNGDRATKEYGDKAKNGVVLITTKKQ